MSSSVRGNGVSHSVGAGSGRREALRAAARGRSGDLRARARPPAAVLPRTIFISYSRNDMHVVRPLVDRLRARGAAVTWDQDFAAGADFEQASCQAIDAAGSVIVVWSGASVQSRYVRDEAQRALRTSRLIPTYVAGFNLSDLPLGFGPLNAVPLDDEEWVRRSLAAHGIELRG